MDTKELETQIKELEERLDRLRTLYEQYFLGFEKLEPQIPRKDVDRRFALLRKDQIRNTALRFRFNVATQKYNTYSMYWTRICRQIEEGTYKRHIARAEKRFGRRAARGLKGDQDVSVDIDLADFEPESLDDVLAEADAHAAKIERNVSDTLPPESVPPPLAPHTPNSPMKPAAVPADARGRVVLRKIGSNVEAPRAAAASAPGAPLPNRNLSPTTPNAPMPTRDLGSQRKVIVRPRAPTAPTPDPAANKLPIASPRAPAANVTEPTSERRVPVRPPAPSAPEPTSDRRIPVRPPVAGVTEPTSDRRIPVRPPVASVPDKTSERRVPAAPPSSEPRFPMPPPPPSARRIPVAEPQPVPKGPRPPAPAPPPRRAPPPLPSQTGKGPPKKE